MKGRSTLLSIRFFPPIITLLVIFITNSLFASGQWKPATALLPTGVGGENVMVRLEKQDNNLIALSYKVPAPRFQPVAYQAVRGTHTSRCSMGNMSLHTEVGNPEVPYIYSRVIIPYGRTIASIRVVPKESVTLEGSYLLTYGENPTPLSFKTVVWAKPNAAVYESDNAFPGKTYDLVSMGYRCGVAIAYVHIYPLTYYPNSGRISFFRNFTLEITLKPGQGNGTDIKPRPDKLLQGIITEENPEALSTYTPHSLSTKETYTYLVIAGKSLIDAQTDPKLSDLIALRESKGFTCKVESIENVLANSTGSTSQDKLRNYIKEAYTNWGTQFVLLGGDTAIIPLKTVSASNGGTTDNIPTDMPYQCLDQATWSADYDAEVFIGRFSAQNATEFSNQIYKTIKYETDPASESYFTNHLSLGEKLDASTYATGSLNALEALFSNDYTFDSLYDSPSYSWSKTECIDKINTNRFSIIDHFGHSNTSYVMKLSNGDETKFTNTKFSFSKSQGCIPGAFDRDCIGERFTNSTRTGMFAVVFNARYGWYQPGNPTGGSSHKVHVSFWKACWDSGMSYFGEFNEYSHRVNTSYKWDILESNLLGDPAVKFRGKEVAPFLQVFSPNGGEVWERDRDFEIKWDDNIDHTIKIELLKGTLVDRILTASTPSNGTFTWNIASDFPIGTDYKIKITSTVTDTIIDQSDNFFAIEEKSMLALMSPNGGEALEKEKTYDITWSDNLTGKVDIALYKGASFYSDIVTGAESNGTYQWKVSGDIQSGTTYKVRITGVDKTWLYDESDSTIIIRNPLVAIPYSQDFDAFDTGAVPLRSYWEQLDVDDIDWTVQQGPTPSRVGSDPNKTGPTTDHTTGNNTGKYLFTEASGNNAPDMNAYLVTPVFTTVNASSAIMSFYYHMFSANSTMGTLDVDIKEETDTGWTLSIIKLSGDQGDSWKTTSFDLKDYLGKNIQFRFRGKTGSNWCSDICFDDFKIDATIVGINDINTIKCTSYDLKYYNSRIYFQVPFSINNRFIRIDLYNIQGKLVQTIAQGKFNAGVHSARLDNNINGRTALASGLYICKMKTDGYTKTINILLRR